MVGTNFIFECIRIYLLEPVAKVFDNTIQLYDSTRTKLVTMSCITGNAGNRLKITTPSNDVAAIVEVTPGAPTSTNEVISGFQVYRVGDGSVDNREYSFWEFRGNQGGSTACIFGMAQEGTGSFRDLLFKNGGDTIITLRTDTFLQIHHKVIMDPAINFELDTVTGTKFGTAASEKLAFYGATPIVKQTGVAVDAAGIHAALVNLGLISA